jgi:hypothetical protein
VRVGIGAAVEQRLRDGGGVLEPDRSGERLRTREAVLRQMALDRLHRLEERH